MKRDTREWIKKAEADYEVAQLLMASDDWFTDQIAFHCQQSAEKYLKAILVEAGDPIPRTHILHTLVVQATIHHTVLSKYQRGMRFLTRFAVAFRYPGEHATKRQAKSALRWAEALRVEVRGILGLKL